MLNKINNFLLFNSKTLRRFKTNYINNYYENSYSQEGEDMILKRIFGDKKNGFYIDVGAHHPKRFSNTYYFYKKGWKGINIDAMPGSMNEFNRIRKRDINIEQPISDTQELLKYYIFNEPALNGFSEELFNERNKMEQYYLKDTKNLKTKTLNSVLEKYLPKDINKIDFLTIDVEGLDLNVLKSICLKRYNPEIILAEVLNNDIEKIKDNEITLYLAENGYSVIAKSVNTVFFKRNYKFYTRVY